MMYTKNENLQSFRAGGLAELPDYTGTSKMGLHLKKCLLSTST